MRLATLVLLGLPLLANAPAWADDEPDLEQLGRIRAEGFHGSQVMDHARHLTDVIGPRLTGSPRMRQANDWTLRQFAAWGLTDARLEGYEFGEGWSFTRCQLQLVSPADGMLAAVPKAWTPPTRGTVRGTAMRAKLDKLEDLEALAGKIAGKILFVSEDEQRTDTDKPMFERYTQEELRELEAFDVPTGRDGDTWRKRRREREAMRRRMNELLVAEGAVAVVERSSFEHGAVRVGGGGTMGHPGDPEGVPSLVASAEAYDRVTRLLADGETVELELTVEAMYHRGDPTAWNTLADLPGRDRRGEVVMAGAHLDSWHAGTGATDNAAGVAIVMEAARVLKQLGVAPKRTIRFALWSGEEQGLRGSRAYVAEHYATRPAPTDSAELALAPGLRQETWPILPKPAHAKLAAYFNLDNGGGRIRGLYAQENLGAKSLFEQWTAPVRDLGVDVVTMENTSSTDHIPFDRVGLPGFQFVQDQRDYFTRTHHSSLDTFDYLDRDDLVQAAVVLASVLWQAANHEGAFPRKPMPEAPPDRAKQTPAPDAAAPVAAGPAAPAPASPRGAGQ